MRTNPWTGILEDDLERFFLRPAHKVSSADIWRWRACCNAQRELDGET
jgi:hypothetical protein